MQVAGLRQRGALEQARMAQAAAQAEAARADAEARANRAMEMQRWEREMMDRARAAELAQRSQQEKAELAQRSRASELASTIGLARLEAEKAHYKEMEQRDADKIKAKLNLPTRLHIGTIGDNVIGTDPYTGESKVLYSAPGKEKSIPKRSGVTAHGLLLNPASREAGTLSGPVENLAILEAMGTNVPPSLRSLQRTLKGGGLKVLSIGREGEGEEETQRPSWLSVSP